MKWSIILILAFLGGCAQSPTDVVHYCLQRESVESCGRIGCSTVQVCVRERIGCNEPLTLTEKDGVLSCHLENPAQ